MLSSMNPDFNQRPVKTMNGMVGALLILIVGLFAVVGGYFIAENSTIPKSYVTTNGQVKSSGPGIKGDYNVAISYTVNGKPYFFVSQVPSESAQHDSVYFAGNNTIKVAYNPQNPGQSPKNASDKTTKVAGKAFEIIGGIFAVLGLISTVQQLITKAVGH
jgi:hypothetical protein